MCENFLFFACELDFCEILTRMRVSHAECVRLGSSGNGGLIWISFSG
jgi:hypothetical protein